MKKLVFPLLFFFELYAPVIGGLNFYFRIKTYAPLQWGVAFVPFPLAGKILCVIGVLLLLTTFPVVRRIKKDLLPVICCRGMFLCGFFAGQLPWGFYNWRVVIGKHGDRKMQTAELKKLIPPGKTIQTILGYQAHFAGKNPLESFSGSVISEKAEYLTLPFSDFFVSKKDLQQIALKVKASAAWKCLAVDPDPQRGVPVFVRIRC